MNTFRKRASAPAIRTEAASLRWLADAAREGGASVVPLVDEGDGWLETAYLVAGRPSPVEAEEFGRRLARTHAAGAPWWAAPPPGLDPSDSLLAELPQPVATSEAAAPATWGEFYVSHRVLPYVRLAADAGALEPRHLAVVERSLTRIEDGAYESRQPRGCTPVARIHGDLWGGNVLWASTADGVVGTLIDPAAHGGHAETDLAELALFGSPHLERTLAAYDEVAPLEAGWRERVPLHQLHMLAVHAALFGRGYGAELAAAASRYA